LVHRPSVLLLDEPWSGLDTNGAEQLDALLREERERGAIVIAVSHEPERAARLDARRLRLERGRLAQ
jgi:ABC-type multidrug transport system ATPase subunit